MRRFRVELTTRYIVALNDNFREMYTGRDGNEYSRGRWPDIAVDLAIKMGEYGHSLSESDGYVDLPDDAATVRMVDMDTEVEELSS